MRYTYNETAGVTNGVMFFFERGDEEIALRTFDVINASEQRPTSIVWDGLCLEPLEAIRLLRTASMGNGGYLGVRFTVNERELLKSYLTFLRAAYPALALLTREVDSRVFGTRH